MKDPPSSDRQLNLHFLLSFRSDDDHRYWFADPTPSLGPLYPHNTYHGAPTASGAKQPHHRAPLNLEFKPIRFTEEYTPSSSSSPSKSQQQQQQQRRGRMRQLSSNEGPGDDQVGTREGERGQWPRSDLQQQER